MNFLAPRNPGVQPVAAPEEEPCMSLKDKLEIGLKPDAPYRPDNLPEGQQDDPACSEAGVDGSAGGDAARDACDDGPVRPVEKPVEKVTGER
jgi:hypothetical protein